MVLKFSLYKKDKKCAKSYCNSVVFNVQCYYRNGVAIVLHKLNLFTVRVFVMHVGRQIFLFQTAVFFLQGREMEWRYEDR